MMPLSRRCLRPNADASQIKVSYSHKSTDNKDERTKLSNKMTSFLFRNWSLFLDIIFERPAATVFHNEMYHEALLDNIVQAYNVGMIRPAHDLNFIIEGFFLLGLPTGQTVPV